MSHALLYLAPSAEEATLPERVLQQSADVEHVLVDSFGIEDARLLNERAHRRAYGLEGRAFLISASVFTTEAQNALLKLFEDPPHAVTFYVVVPREDVLIPTLRSRFVLAGSTKFAKDTAAFSDFMRMSYKDRLEEVAAHAKQKNTAWFESVMAGAEQYCESQLQNENQQNIKSVLQVRNYLGARGSSSKMLFEELALLLPVQ